MVLNSRVTAAIFNYIEISCQYWWSLWYNINYVLGGIIMELYNKENLKVLKDSLLDDSYYMPKGLFQSNKNLRLETKLAYVAILDTLLKKANYNQDGIASLKRDNPTIVITLEKLANKDVDKDKMEKYFNELCEANLIEIKKQDIFVYLVD